MQGTAEECLTYLITNSGQAFQSGLRVEAQIKYNGQLLDFVPVPKDEVTNCAFGGKDLKTLYITAGSSLWSVRVNTPGRVTFGD